MSAGGATHLPLLAAGRSRWACASAAAGDAYVRVVRAKAVPAARVTAGGDGGGRCATRRAPPLPSPPPPAGMAGRRGPAPALLPAHARARGTVLPGPLSRTPARLPAGLRPPRVPGGGRRPYSCPPAHFADGETDARSPQMPRARSLRVRTQVCQNREPKLSPAYWRLFSPEESRGVHGEGFPCSECLPSACCRESRSNNPVGHLGSTWFQRPSSDWSEAAL